MEDGPGTILVIEDDPALAEILRIFLEDSGSHIVVAETGREGLDLARRLRPELVTLDLALPDIDGREVLRQIQADADLADVPIIVVTGRRFQPGPEEKVVTVLRKPFDAAALEQAVRRALPRAPGNRAPG